MDRDLVSDIKARLTIEEVVGSYITLKRAGSSYKALSPFKEEKTPSLIVTPSKELWKDFSSGKGGDLFKFVMEYEGVEFRQALEILALKAGLEMSQYQSNPRIKKKQDLRKMALKVLEVATKFYQSKLKTSSLAQAYLKKRGFQSRVVRDFRLGYSPASWEALLKHFENLKITPKQGAVTGLIKKRPMPAWLIEKTQSKETERFGDFFADRLMIPLSDGNGQIIGFTGRLLKDKVGIAKYINTSHTVLYDKSKHVFGYFQAKDYIRQTGFSIVVEGNLDVISCHQSGFKQVVACGGTALTLNHLKIIGRLTDDIRLAFDGDEAGIAAMERSLISASQAKVNLSMISLPSGYDPDDLVKHNLSLWQELISKPQPALDWLYDKYKSQLDLSTAEGKKHLTDIMLSVINQLQDEVEQDHYLQKLAEEVKISRSSLDKKLAKIDRQDFKHSYNRADPRDFQAETDVLAINGDKHTLSDKVQLLIGLLLFEPSLRKINKERDQSIKNILKNYPNLLEVYKILMGSSYKAIARIEDLPASLQSKIEHVRIPLQLVSQNTYDSSAIRIQAFTDLFRQLHIQQMKSERQV
ncbi:MAG: DNA primase [Candidatus Saccharibacteria bacterium]|nr:DNA primase [Candidatus Saccharibacteria bacterium]